MLVMMIILPLGSLLTAVFAKLILCITKDFNFLIRKTNNYIFTKVDNFNLLDNIPDNCIAVGNPAETIKVLK